MIFVYLLLIGILSYKIEIEGKWLCGGNTLLYITEYDIDNGSIGGRYGESFSNKNSYLGYIYENSISIVLNNTNVLTGDVFKYITINSMKCIKLLEIKKYT
jgi:hypothetical protein